MTCITQYASPGGASQRHVLGNTRHREEPPSDAYWVIHVTGRNLRILTVNTNNWVWGFNLHNNNVNAMHLARTYWGIPSSSFEIGGQYHLPPSACGLRGSGWYWPPISQDSDGIPQYVLARCMVFLQYHFKDAVEFKTHSPCIKTAKIKTSLTRHPTYISSPQYSERISSKIAISFNEIVVVLKSWI